MATRIKRSENRTADGLRSIEIVRRFTRNAPGSVLIRTGCTHVLCTASFEEGVPKWKSGQGTGWVTAEYDMLPGATHQRRPRNRQRVDGRTQEIQRLIGRSMRSIVDMEALGENTIIIDCDVLQADGGTRTASINGAYIALCDAVRTARRNRQLSTNPILESVAAISVGIVGGRVLVDLDYAEDSSAQVDLNVVMTGAAGRFIEVQGTAESGAFTRAELDRMIQAAARALRKITQHQEQALKRRVS